MEINVNTTVNDLLNAGFYKVAENNGIFCTATFYNPDLNQTITHCVRDYDYSDCSRDNDDLYYMEIDENARRKYLHSLGNFCPGDLVTIYKGRKYPIGTTGRIESIKPFNDIYGRYVCNYLYLDNGVKVSADNCKLMEAVNV